MPQQTPWLRLASFAGRISLPANFKLSVFEPFIYLIERNELRNILGQERLESLITWVSINPNGKPTQEDTVLDPFMSKLYELVVEYLVFAVYAQYIFKGDVQVTDTGLVTKDRESSDAISDARRMSLWRDYRDTANSIAADITTFLTPPTACSSPAGVGNTEVVISSSRGRTSSKTSSW